MNKLIAIQNPTTSFDKNDLDFMLLNLKSEYNGILNSMKSINDTPKLSLRCLERAKKLLVDCNNKRAILRRVDKTSPYITSLTDLNSSINKTIASILDLVGLLAQNTPLTKSSKKIILLSINMVLLIKLAFNAQHLSNLNMIKKEKNSNFAKKENRINANISKTEKLQEQINDFMKRVKGNKQKGIFVSTENNNGFSLLELFHFINDLNKKHKLNIGEIFYTWENFLKKDIESLKALLPK